MSVRLRTPVACLVLLSLTGCNVAIAGALVQPTEGARAAAPQGERPSVFNLAPDGAVPKVSAVARAAAAWPGDDLSKLALSLAQPGAGTVPAADAGAAAGRDNIVKLLGRAQMSNKARGIANVRDGLVTGSQIRVIDAQTGKTVSSAVSFYDGSFAVDVRFKSASSAVILTTELIDAANPKLKATLSAPLHLRATEGERKVSITPGSTALTSFLQAVATMQETGDVQKAREALPDDATALANVSGPRLGSLIVAMKDEENKGFAAVAAAAPELSGAESVTALRAAIMKFVGRLSVKKAGD